MPIYVVAITHKRASGFVEIIKIFIDKNKAEAWKNEFNIPRPVYSRAIVFRYEVYE
jgi:hypothetical protein